MRLKLNRLSLLLFLTITSIGCRSYIEFELKRYSFGFIITLVIAVIWFIILFLTGGSKK